MADWINKLEAGDAWDAIREVLAKTRTKAMAIDPMIFHHIEVLDKYMSQEERRGRPAKRNG